MKLKSAVGVFPFIFVLLATPVAAAAQRPGVNYCSEHPSPVFVVRCPQDLADCDTEWQRHQCSAHGRCGSVPPTPEGPPFGGPVGFALVAAPGAGALAGSLLKSNVTGENQWKTGALAGAALGGGLAVAVGGKSLSTGATTALLGAAGAAGGAAHGQFQKALGNEDTTMRDAGVGAVLGATTGFAIGVFSPNLGPFGRGRFARAVRHARVVSSGGFIGIMVRW